MLCQLSHWGGVAIQDLMYDLEDTRGSASMLYVFVVVFMGNFIIMNLALAGTSCALRS